MEINIGIIGFGTIGIGVVKILQENSELIKKRTGIKINLKKLCDIDLETKRDVKVDKEILTKDVNDILENDEIDIVVELIGGYEPARSFILKAINNKKHVVTANKALVAKYAKEIFDAARKNNVQVNFEAAVGGCIPIIKSLKQSYIGENITSIYGILNGTTNYIFTRMNEGMGYEEALKKAQELGFAEPDPSFDVKGLDAAQKIMILSMLSFNTEIKDVYAEGITEIDKKDIKIAQELGYAIKLLALAKKENNKLEIRVHPTMIDNKHLLSTVKNELNAIYVIGKNIKDVMFYGRGAGQLPTATVVVGDIINIAKNNNLDIPEFFENIKIKDIDLISSRYYLRINLVKDSTDEILDLLKNNKIEIKNKINKDKELIIETDKVVEKDIKKVIKDIKQLDIVENKVTMIRIEDI